MALYTDLESRFGSQARSVFDWQTFDQPNTTATQQDAPEAEQLLKSVFSSHLKLQQHFATSSHAHASLIPSTHFRHRTQLDPDQLEIFERRLLGESQKSIAMDMCVSQSLVSTALQRTTQHFSGNRSGAVIPLLLILLAHAARLPCTHVNIDREGMNHPVLNLSISRPDYLFAKAFPRYFTDAEFHVLRLLVEGYSPAGICAARGSKPRTVANQLSTVYSKLRTSGRVSVWRQLQLYPALASTPRADPVT